MNFAVMLGGAFLVGALARIWRGRTAAGWLMLALLVELVAWVAAVLAIDDDPVLSISRDGNILVMGVTLLLGVVGPAALLALLGRPAPLHPA